MFVAIARLRFGDGFLEPGDPVPVEPGRDYTSMVHLGQIAAVHAQPDAPPIVPQPAPAPAAVTAATKKAPAAPSKPAAPPAGK